MTREEAIRIIEANCSCSESTLMEACTMFIPELRESYDERIRKSIVETIKKCPDTFLNPKNRDGMLTYLEKQKEYHIPWYDYQKSKEAGYTIVPNEEYEQLIKQKEQKPAEWSDTNELVFKDICKHLKEEGYNGWIVLLNALRNGEFQPKQEWSEEDEAAYNAFICDVVNEKMNPTLEQVKWFRSIRDRLESLSPIKPAWSKEDETIIEGACNALEIHGHTKLAERLKSLRPQPHWKPSEEQMSMLRAVINVPNTSGAESCQIALRGIYEQLKKLM